VTPPDLRPNVYITRPEYALIRCEKMSMDRKRNHTLVKLIQDLKTLSREHDAPIWRTIAKKLEGPSRNWAEVNISRIARHSKEGETLIVPGKLLGAGLISFSVIIAAYNISNQAKHKIEAAGGKILTIRELSESHPDGTGIRIMG